MAAGPAFVEIRAATPPPTGWGWGHILERNRPHSKFGRPSVGPYLSHLVRRNENHLGARIEDRRAECRLTLERKSYPRVQSTVRARAAEVSRGGQLTPLAPFPPQTTAVVQYLLVFSIFGPARIHRFFLLFVAWGGCCPSLGSAPRDHLTPSVPPPSRTGIIYTKVQ